MCLRRRKNCASSPQAVLWNRTQQPEDRLPVQGTLDARSSSSSSSNHSENFSRLGSSPLEVPKTRWEAVHSCQLMGRGGRGSGIASKHRFEQGSSWEQRKSLIPIGGEKSLCLGEIWSGRCMQTVCREYSGSVSNNFLEKAAWAFLPPAVEKYNYSSNLVLFSYTWLLPPERLVFAAINRDLADTGKVEIRL